LIIFGEAGAGLDGAGVATFGLDGIGWLRGAKVDWVGACLEGEIVALLLDPS